MRRKSAKDYRRHARGEGGFTLIELLVVIVILPLIVGAIAVALLAVFKNSTVASSTISQSGDTQVVSSEFVTDVQSASTLTTMPTPASPAVCATASQMAAPAPGFHNLVSFDSTDGKTEVSYVQVPDATGNIRVFRNFCPGGSTTPTVLGGSTTAVARTAQSVQTVVAGSPCPLTLGQGATCPASTVWTSAAGTAYVKLTITAPIPKSSTTYTYSLQAAPRTSNSVSLGNERAGSLSVLLLGSAGPDWGCSGTMNVTSGQMVMDSTSGGASGGTVTANGGFYTADTGNPSAALSGTTALPAGAPLVSGPPIPDPYKNLAPPSVPALSPTNGGPIGGVYEPGLYTSTLSPGNSPLVSGIYYLDAGFSAGGNDNVTNQAGGVLLYIAGGNFSMGGTSSVVLSPLASPPSPVVNMVIWQAASDGQTLSLHGTGSGSAINGTIYAPGASLDIKGGGNGNGFTAGALLAQAVDCNSPNGQFTVNGET